MLCPHVYATWPYVCVRMDYKCGVDCHVQSPMVLAFVLFGVAYVAAVATLVRDRQQPLGNAASTLDEPDTASI